MQINFLSHNFSINTASADVRENKRFSLSFSTSLQLLLLIIWASSQNCFSSNKGKPFVYVWGWIWAFLGYDALYKLPSIEPYKDNSPNHVVYFPSNSGIVTVLLTIKAGKLKTEIWILDTTVLKLSYYFWVVVYCRVIPGHINQMIWRNNAILS